MSSFSAITWPTALCVFGIFGVVSAWQHSRYYDVPRGCRMLDTNAPIAGSRRSAAARISPSKAALNNFFDGEYPSQPVVVHFDNSTCNCNEDDLDIKETTYRINLQLARLAQEAARHNHHRSKRSQMAAEALRLFESSLKSPDTVSYNSLLKVLAKASPCYVDGRTLSSAQVALDKFREMRQVHQQQTEANQVFYQRFEREDSPSAADVVVRVRPNVRTYATLLDSWSRMGTVEAATQCQQLLEEFIMTEREQSGDLDNSEDWLVCYNTVLAAWAKVGGSLGAARCLALWQDMLSNHIHGVQPDRISFHTVLNALAKSGRPDAGAIAEGLLKEQQQQQQQQSKHTFQVTARSYTTVMDAWGRSSGRPDRAHALLDELVALSSSVQNEKNKDLQPSLVTYTTVIHAYASSHIRDKASKAYQVFQQMQRQKQKLRPNCVTYNTMLNCCATSLPTTIVPIPTDSGVDDAGIDDAPLYSIMEMVMRIYRQFLDQAPAGAREIDFSDEKEYTPDVVTFATVLKACSRHRHPLLFAEHSEQFAESVFCDACSFGCVSPTVLWQLRQAVPIDRYRVLLQGHHQEDDIGRSVVGREQLPASWTRRVPLEEWHNTTRKGRGRRNNNRQSYC